MATKEGFKQTELGEIPVEWSLKEMGDLFEIKQGKALSKKHREGKRPRPFLRTSNVFWGYTKISDLDEMDFTKEEEEKYELKKNDLLICEGGDIGRTAILNQDLPGIFYQNHVFRVRAKKDYIYPKYAMFWMDAAQNLFDHYSGTANKTTIANLSKSRLSRYKVSLPPLAEQKAIAQKLTVIRNAIEQTQAVIEATEELKKSMMKHLFTYGPVPVDQTDQVELKETDIGLVPKDWEIKSLNKLIREKVFNGAFVKGDKFGSGTLFLNVKDVYRNLVIKQDGLDRVEVEEKEEKKYSLEYGDIIVVRSSLKKAGIARCCIYQGTMEKMIYDCHLMRLRVNQNEIDPKYLAYYINSPIGHKQLLKRSKTTTMTTINQSGLLKLPVAFPSKKDQIKIREKLEHIDEKIAMEIDKKTALESLFNSTLESLMTAKIRVN
jgi:type I restriction enzyme S subunit